MSTAPQPASRASRAIVIGFCAVLAAAWVVPGAPVDENRARTEFPAFSRAGLASASDFRVVDAALVDRLGLKGDVVGAVGSALLAANVSTSPQVFLGPQGDTFFAPDFSLACEQRPLIPDAVTRISALRDTLQRRREVGLLGTAILGEKTHDRHEDLALAGTGFADDAERLARIDGEAHVVDGPNRAFRRGKTGFQALDVEDGGHRFFLNGPWGRARRAVRRR